MYQVLVASYVDNRPKSQGHWNNWNWALEDQILFVNQFVYVFFFLLRKNVFNHFIN